MGLKGVAVAAIALLGVASAAQAQQRAGDSDIDLNTGIGAVIPLSKYRQTVDHNIGAGITLEAGYRYMLTDNLGLGIAAGPLFTFLPTALGVKGIGTNLDDQTGSNFAITAGPKLSLLTDVIEYWPTALGGYYRAMRVPMDDDGEGFQAGGGLRIRVTPQDSLGVFGRYDYSTQHATPFTDNTRQFVTSGFSYNHSFAAPAVAEYVPPPPPPAPVRRKIVLRGVHFDFDKSNIRPDARPILDEAIRILKNEPEIRVSVEGYTDSMGTDAYNQRLSERRARSVVDYLVAGGISRSRLDPVGFGESDPVASNTTEEGRAQNRRVELKVLNN
jgi:outer membrane protein OmpA-like peptidoglycan-associated protein